MASEAKFGGSVKARKSGKAAAGGRRGSVPDVRDPLVPM